MDETTFAYDGSMNVGSKCLATFARCGYGGRDCWVLGPSLVAWCIASVAVNGYWLLVCRSWRFRR